MIDTDEEYEMIPPLPWPNGKKGIQCGECGMKFDHGTTYGYVCGNQRCPIMPPVISGTGATA